MGVALRFKSLNRIEECVIILCALHYTFWTKLDVDCLNLFSAVSRGISVLILSSTIWHDQLTILWIFWKIFSPLQSTSFLVIFFSGAWFLSSSFSLEERLLYRALAFLLKVAGVSLMALFPSAVRYQALINKQTLLTGIKQGSTSLGWLSICRSAPHRSQKITRLDLRI